MEISALTAMARGAALGLFLGAMIGPASALTQLQLAQAHIQHVIVIMQENRSFDHYFGTFPGAEGIKFDANGRPLMCYPLNGGGCVRPFHDRHNINGGGGHSYVASISDIRNNAMNGFLIVQENGIYKCIHSSEPIPGMLRHDAVGYHTAAEIPNYWTYAQHFVLQDHLFEAVASDSMRRIST